MSKFNKFKEQNYLHDPVAAAKNKALAQQHFQKKNMFVRLFNWLTSLEDKLRREIIINWIILLAPIIFIICVMTTWDYIFEESNAHVNSLGAGFLISMLSFMAFIVSLVLKVSYRIKKKKGTYWPEYKAPTPFKKGK